MSDKVRLPREVADVIGIIRAKGIPNGEIIERHITEMHIQVNGYEKLKPLATDILIRALYIGYEIEETPEDMVREFYKTLKEKSINEKKGETMYTDRLIGLLHTLKLLEIEIEGVHD